MSISKYCQTLSFILTPSPAKRKEWLYMASIRKSRPYRTAYFLSAISEPLVVTGFFWKANRGIRTPDLRITSASLYRLSYTSKSCLVIILNAGSFVNQNYSAPDDYKMYIELLELSEMQLRRREAVLTDRGGVIWYHRVFRPYKSSPHGGIFWEK